MEKIQRKVSCEQRLPILSKLVLTDLGWLRLKIIHSGARGFVDINNVSPYKQPEYWYEEIDLNELITLERQKYLIELAEKYKETMSNDLQQNLAKERYEKALELLNTVLLNPNWYKIGKRALKIAAGLNEEN